MVTIHDQLKAACDRAGISMKALCLQAGVSEATIASWKKGDPSTVTTLQKILNVLGPDTLVEMMVQSTKMPGAVDYAHMAKVAHLQAEYFERMAGIDRTRNETCIVPGAGIKGLPINKPSGVTATTSAKVASPEPTTLYGWLRLLPGHLASGSIAYMELRNGDRVCGSMSEAMDILCQYLIGADVSQEWYWRGVAAFVSSCDEEFVRDEARVGYAAAKLAFSQSK